MSESWLLISPLARRAYFAQTTELAALELKTVLGIESQHRQIGDLDFLVSEQALPADGQTARLAFLQGLFQLQQQEPLSLAPTALDPLWHLPEAFTHGSSYAGKTNEMVTQLAINLALGYCEVPGNEPHWLLDPMAGQGTTLLWAARYGISSVGIEPRGECLDRLHAQVLKQCKLTRSQHSASAGFAGGRGKNNPFRQYDFADSSLRLIQGDSRETGKLVKRKFSLAVADLPYGIAHRSSDGDSNPAELVEAAAPSWAAQLKGGGVLALIYNRYQPKPSVLKKAIEDAGLKTIEFAAAHRMSESIERDILLAVKPR